MSTTLGTCITAIRNEHPAFDVTRVPAVVLGSYLSRYQNELIGLGVGRDKTFLTQSVAIAIGATHGTASEGGQFVDLGPSGVPFASTVSGFLVQLNADGVPFIDPAHPIIISVEQGITLPVLRAVIGGTVHYNDSARGERLAIVSYDQRFDPPHFPAVYFTDKTLHLVGNALDWEGIDSIELRYSPVAPAFAAPTDLLLVPDDAVGVMVARGVAFASQRVAAFAQKDAAPMPDVGLALRQAAEAEERWLATFRLTKRARVTTFREETY